MLPVIYWLKLAACFMHFKVNSVKGFCCISTNQLSNKNSAQVTVLVCQYIQQVFVHSSGYCNKYLKITHIEDLASQEDCK